MTRTALALVCSVLVPAVACTTGPGTERGDDLGRRIAGTWLATYEIDVPDSAPVAFIVTYHADGTATTSSERMFGAGDPDRHGLGGTGHIQWEAAGPREIRWRVLHFGYDSDGGLSYISRTHGVREFDERFESSRGSFHVEVFPPATLLDPLDPNGTGSEPLATAEGTDTARRLHVRIPDGSE
jgi:hypothetical protein